MSIEDEIRAKKERMHAEEKKRQEHEILLTALRNVGMSENYPVLIFAPNELQSIISEALPYMRFFQPKIVRNMPGTHMLEQPAVMSVQTGIRSMWRFVVNQDIIMK